jgi:hypothetical protein
MEGLRLVILRSMSVRHLNVVMSVTVVRVGGAPGICAAREVQFRIRSQSAAFQDWVDGFGSWIRSV